MSTQGKIINCKAAVSWSANEKLAIEDIEVHPPKHGEVRVKILATGIVRNLKNFIKYSKKHIF